MISGLSSTDLWKQAVGFISGKIGETEAERWLSPLRLEYRPTGRLVRLVAPNRFFIDWIRDNYLASVQEALNLTLRQTVNIEFSTGDGPAARPPETDSPPPTPLARPEPTVKTRPINQAGHGVNRLNDRYTFDTFVVGESNNFAHAAAQAVAAQPGFNYNPLFIYGGAGLGKTHLMNAIGHQIQAADTQAQVAYLSSEVFTNQMIDAIRNKTMDRFRARYRSVDALLIDDIHFLGTKERTQEEFFFTFNALYDTSKQIVLTSDQRPKDIPGLEERLRSRFEWGLIADIQAPDRETKVAIIQKKAEFEHIKLPEEVAYMLASNEETNIRVLEGYLVRLAAHSSVSGEPISANLAKDVLQDALAPREITADDIIRRVSERYNIRLTDLKGPRKEKKISEPRQIAMYLTRKLTPLPLVQIGQKFGGKDHSTVVHAVKKIKSRMDHNFDFKQEVNNLEKVVRRG